MKRIKCHVKKNQLEKDLEFIKNNVNNICEQANRIYRLHGCVDAGEIEKRLQASIKLSYSTYMNRERYCILKDFYEKIGIADTETFSKWCIIDSEES